MVEEEEEFVEAAAFEAENVELDEAEDVAGFGDGIGNGLEFRIDMLRSSCIVVEEERGFAENFFVELEVEVVDDEEEEDEEKDAEDVNVSIEEEDETMVELPLEELLLIDEIDELAEVDEVAAKVPIVEVGEDIGDDCDDDDDDDDGDDEDGVEDNVGIVGGSHAANCAAFNLARSRSLSFCFWAFNFSFHATHQSHTHTQPSTSGMLRTP